MPNGGVYIITVTIATVVIVVVNDAVIEASQSHSMGPPRQLP
jgi:hypothetical protein